LLQVSDAIAEVSKDHIITRIWEGDISIPGCDISNIGKKIAETGDDSIFRQCDDLVTRSFALRDNNYINYDSSSSSYSIRVLAIHPGKDFLFVVIKKLASKEEVAIAEDKWRLALDAAHADR
jgi:hypothetical protein